MTTRTELSRQREEILAVARRHGVISVRVFGSVVRGEDTPASDIDLLVSMGPTVSPWFPAGLARELEALLGHEVDIVTEKGLNPLLRDQVLAVAVEL